MAIANCFSSLLTKIEPRDKDIQLYERHKGSVTRRLETVFNTNRVEQIGSYSRGSAIRDTSDIDLMLILSVREVRWGKAGRRPPRSSTKCGANCKIDTSPLRSAETVKPS